MFLDGRRNSFRLRPALLLAALALMASWPACARQNPDAQRGAPTEGIASSGSWSFSYDDRGYEIAKTGSAPWQVQNTNVTLTIKNPALTRATLLDTAGYPIKPLALTRAAGKCSLQLPADAMYFVLE